MLFPDVPERRGDVALVLPVCQEVLGTPWNICPRILAAIRRPENDEVGNGLCRYRELAQEVVI